MAIMFGVRRQADGEPRIIVQLDDVRLELTLATAQAFVNQLQEVIAKADASQSDADTDEQKPQLLQSP
ncbi:MAG: hypothetical protein SF123_09675 [Chloroflexota bacterium]|nr:hypothetical protein [Chloroflexota bacterium]